MIRLLLIILLSANAYAGGIDQLRDYYSSRGGMSNHTKPSSFKDQRAGYISGGSLVLRGPRPAHLQPLTVMTPKASFDPCTGNGDFRFGAVSFVQGEEFRKFLQDMGQRVPAYAFKLFVKTTCPMCEDIMSEMDAIAREVNQFSLNSCAMSKQLVDGAYNRITSARSQGCMINASRGNYAKDISGAAATCQASPDKVEKAAGNDDTTKSLLGDEYNLVWKALKGESRELKELIMSVTGTIIAKKNGEQIAFQARPSLFTTEALMQKIIGRVTGSESYQLYSCSEQERCLDVTKETKTIKAENTFLGNITRIIAKMAEKLADDIALIFDDEEEMLVNHIHQPIFSIIETEIDTRGSADGYISNSEVFLELVAYEVVSGFIGDLIDKADEAVSNLKKAQIDNSVFIEFNNSLKSVRTVIHHEQEKANRRLMALFKVKKRIEYERDASAIKEDEDLR